MSLRSEVVLMASRRVLAEAGRAPIHDLRGDLNLATLGAALLAEPADPDPIRVGGRGADSVTRGLARAGAGRFQRRAGLVSGRGRPGRAARKSGHSQLGK